MIKRHIQSHQVKIGAKMGYPTLCKKKVGYAGTAPRLDLGIPATDYCGECIEGLILKKQRQIEMLRDILECSK